MIILPIVIEKIATRKDHTLSIYIGTNETSPATVGELMQLHNTHGFMAFSAENFKPDQTEMLKGLKTNEVIGKTPSERLRSVLYVWHGQDNKGFSSFDAFYNHFMEKYIDNIKSKLI